LWLGTDSLASQREADVGVTAVGSGRTRSCQNAVEQSRATGPSSFLHKMPVHGTNAAPKNAGASRTRIGRLPHPHRPQALPIPTLVLYFFQASQKLIKVLITNHQTLRAEGR
jgi:hypothetical protein